MASHPVAEVKAIAWNNLIGCFYGPLLKEEKKKTKQTKTK